MTLNLKLCSVVNWLRPPAVCQAKRDVTSLISLSLSSFHVVASVADHVTSGGCSVCQ